MNLPPENPYQPPSLSASPGEPVPFNRAVALRRVRIAAALLVLPSYLNWAFLFLPVSLNAREQFLVAALNLAALSVTWTAVLIWGLRWIDVAAGIIHRFCGGPVTRQQWLATMYAALWPLPWAATAGTCVYFVWLFLFFYVAGETNRYLISAASSTAGHLLGACVYVNVLYHWYRLRRGGGRAALLESGS